MASSKNRPGLPGYGLKVRYTWSKNRNAYMASKSAYTGRRPHISTCIQGTANKDAMPRVNK